ncbi:hypothetical protein [Glycomyces halotolerans]
MNDFELHYMHRSRSRELIAEAEQERRVNQARKARAGHRREGIVARAAKVLRRKERGPAGTARRVQLAK